MGPLAQFILALTNLVRSGAIRKVPQAIKFAEQQFGKVTPLLKKQIEKVFESAKKPLVGKTGKKEGTVLPLVRKIAEKKEEGIASLDDSSALMDKLGKDVEEFRLSDDDPMGDLEQILNPKRPGGSLDPATGLTRALARRILDRKGIEIGKKDPIDVFTDTFGESISDVNNLAEEMLEIDARGGGMKDLDQMLEADGLFDIEIPTNPQKGLTDDELLELIKKTDEEKILTDFDPTGRKPNAKGGLTRTSYAMGKGPVLPEDPTKPVNPFGPKPTGPVLPDKSMMASDDANERLLEQLFEEFLDLGFSPEIAAEKAREEFYKRDYDAKAKQAPSIKLASAYDYNSFDHKINELKAAYKRYKKGSTTGGRKGTMTFEQFAPKFAAENFSTGGRVRAASGGLADLLKL
jgi:hypothetical protein